jgi:hypothetical protein
VIVGPKIDWEAWDIRPKIPDPNDETAEQLQEILELLNRFTGIKPESMEVIGDWIEGKSPPGSTFATRERNLSADIIISWFKDQINDHSY